MERLFSRRKNINPDEKRINSDLDEKRINPDLDEKRIMFMQCECVFVV